MCQHRLSTLATGLSQLWKAAAVQRTLSSVEGIEPHFFEIPLIVENGDVNGTRVSSPLRIFSGSMVSFPSPV